MPVTDSGARSRFAVACAAGSLVSPVVAPTLAAATIAVDTLADNEAADGLCSLREAIQAANDDLPFLGCSAGEDHDLVTLELTGTIALTSDLPDITRNLTLAGPASGTLNLNGGDHRMLVMNGAPNGKTLRIERLTIRNGLNAAGGGCISIQRADRLELVDSRVTGCETPAAGGAIFGDNAEALDDSAQRHREQHGDARGRWHLPDRSGNPGVRWRGRRSDGDPASSRTRRSRATRCRPKPPAAASRSPGRTARSGARR